MVILKGQKSCYSDHIFWPMILKFFYDMWNISTFIWVNKHNSSFYRVCVLVAQSCLTLCNPMDCSLPGSSVHGILQAKILEPVAISDSRGSSRLRDRTWVFCIAGRLFTPEPSRKPFKIGERVYHFRACWGIDLGVKRSRVWRCACEA